jgi:hypothetical protein
MFVFLINCRSETENGKKTNILENNDKITIEKNEEKIKTEIQTEQNTSDSQIKNEIEIDSVVRNIFMVSNSPKLNNEKLNLNFQNISEIQFLNYKNSYDFKIIKEKLVQHDSVKFVIESNNKVYEFNNGFGNVVYPISDFYGFLVPLDSYVIGSGGSGIYNMFLLNKTTDSVINLIKHTDGNDNLPRISPDNKKLISFESDWVETYINMHYIENQTIISYRVHTNTKWNIDDIVWIDNKNLALKVCVNFKYSKKEQNCLRTEYLKAEIE